jgi:ribosomal protein L37E
MSEFKPCYGKLPEKVLEGISAFNAGNYFEAHDLLEEAWMAEAGDIRDLYRGILQIAVCYFHITRQNYEGAQKMYARSLKWLTKWQPNCRGVRVTELLRDAENVIQNLTDLGPERISKFNPVLFKPVQIEQHYWCDRCGAEMFKHNCKISCPNCGNRFDCSDLNIYFD